LKSNCKLDLNKKTFKFTALDFEKKYSICKMNADVLHKAKSDKMYIDCERGQMTKGKGFKTKDNKFTHTIKTFENENMTAINGDNDKEDDRRWSSFNIK